MKKKFFFRFDEKKRKISMHVNVNIRAVKKKATQIHTKLLREKMWSFCLVID